jgi:hypothetical protein
VEGSDRPCEEHDRDTDYIRIHVSQGMKEYNDVKDNSVLLTSQESEKYRICACTSRTFLTSLPSKIGVRLMHGILCPFDD